MPGALHGQPEWVEPEGIQAELIRHGFVDTKAETVDLIHPVADAEGFLASFGVMVKWIINTYWTVEQKEQYEDDFNKILVEHLRLSMVETAGISNQQLYLSRLGYHSSLHAK
ncbi:hypothetical protein BFJ72_g11319 [Fusarium proliferatum]|uniref:Uncharacterized protein n=1 Tax=Gibberella intermedia TaxID=948311 RepID=A0A420SNH7_GIBIN|nr:hypothetical protein BFJ72_g11319 [Fusarium proliferatum]